MILLYSTFDESDRKAERQWLDASRNCPEQCKYLSPQAQPSYLLFQETQSNTQEFSEEMMQ